MLKKIGIEALLTWTYRDELPKLARLPEEGLLAVAGSSSTWAQILQFALLGTKVDTSRSLGLADVVQMVEHPHEDALRVAEAVEALAEATIEMPADFDALGDIGGMSDEERADLHGRAFAIARSKGDDLAALVVRRAIVGDEPTWRDHGPVSRRTMRAANGRDAWFRMVNTAPVGRPAVAQEVDGYDARNHRPFRGAYRKTYLDPCPSLLAAERVEYQAWALGLGFLADRLDGRLADRSLTTELPPLWPWEGEGRREAPRVLIARKSEDARQRRHKAA